MQNSLTQKGNESRTLPKHGELTQPWEMMSC
jgi:hypothetical protein